MAAKPLSVFTREQVSEHNKPGDLWIIVDGKVYDVSRFMDLHPGGASVFLEEDVPGKDATEIFYSLHRHEVLQRPQYARLQIGTIDGEESVITSGEPGKPSQVPYAEPTWLRTGFYSPYYKESHRKLQAALRKHVDEVIRPEAPSHEESGKRPSARVLDSLAELNITAMRMGPGPHLKGLKLMGGIVSPEEFDCFHDLVVTQEICRNGRRGYGDGLLSGALIGLPPVLHFGTPELKAKVVPEVLASKKFLCLAISEAFAGSDVQGLHTRATKTADGKFWIINGTKKWITNGTTADYFTVGCKTDSGFTVILVERGEGVETKPIKTMYSPAAGTAYVTFENVRVPIDNTLGKEGQGMFVILSNFNHERWIMCASVITLQRLIIEETLKWINQRKAFGKPLSSQAVIRSKVAAIIARAESCQSWLENITLQMNCMTYKEQAVKLAGPIALLKMHATKCTRETASDAVQVFGGRGITKSGMGEFIEHAYRAVPFDSILGGAEDVLGDLGVRQAIRQMPKNARL